MPRSKEIPELLTASEVATILRTTRRGIYSQVDRGQLPGVVRLGSRLLFKRDAIAQLIEDCTERAT